MGLRVDSWNSSGREIPLTRGRRPRGVVGERHRGDGPGVLGQEASWWGWGGADRPDSSRGGSAGRGPGLSECRGAGATGCRAGARVQTKVCPPGLPSLARVTTEAL